MAAGPAPAPIVAPTRQQTGAAAEDAALAYLLGQGLQLVARNVRTPGRGGGEVDLILREADGTLVFVEVRARRSARFGGAGASIDARKQQRVALAAQHFLLTQGGPMPPCRFDVVLVGPARDGAAGNTLQWLRAAFDV
ncbi:hypothetical protein AAV94_08430 [Lampropedia cohaerens]|uniref:UPF0102 protein AAV94_08430 n=1 Tax=Lampropedia cohaerens TaxID=1610491 RepID=A0A0U1PYW6_9BURK|nr:YraN family protein [Lampropedia cohaerens]KKW67667.1 hypothetical protein AAV94_08430 [Lampropedia cohaerens]